MELYRTTKTFLAACSLAFAVIFSSSVQATGLRYIETASGSRVNDTLEVIRWTHARLVFEKELARVAVGQAEILEVELLGGKEALMLAKSIGKTSLMVWYTDGSTEALVFGVIEDLAVLRGVLSDIHPNIRIELAPDRAALILRGTVPTIDVKMNAENAAKSYLSADGSGSSEIFNPNTDTSAFTDTDQNTKASAPRTAVINLIKTEQAIASTEEKIQDALSDVSAGVTVKRVMKGRVMDDSLDTFILEGEVKDQVALTRVLSIASSIVVGNEDSKIEVVSDESGGLSKTDTYGNIGANVARAKMLSVAGGRILSIIHVRNIPQVRVAVQIHEVNRTRLKDWKPDFSIMNSDYAPGALSNLPGGIEGPGLFAESGVEVGNALQILNGTMTNNFQIASSDIAFDLLFAMLEEEGISRSLSSPTITVLSGEPAIFEVGGQVPVPSAYSPYSGSFVNNDQDNAQNLVAPGTYSNIMFKKYGVTLDVYPLVDENNVITLDVKPEISQPDIALTKQIADVTGNSSQTTAFNTRSMETRMQVRDGQPLVIGGLISRSDSNTEAYTPGFNQIPGLGWAGRESGKSDNSTELVIIVTPTIVQQPKDELALWQYPSLEDLLERSVGLPSPDVLPERMRPKGYKAAEKGQE
jgi:pilus assembly protein CpaC